MISVVDKADFDTLVPIEFDLIGTQYNKFNNWVTEVKNLGFRGRPHTYCVFKKSNKDVLYYPLVINNTIVVYIQFERDGDYLQCTVNELVDAVNLASELDSKVKNWIKLALSKNYKSEESDNECFCCYIGSKTFWRLCDKAINEVDDVLTSATMKTKIKGSLKINDSTGLVFPCIFTNGEERHLGIVEIDYFYMNLPVLTATCSRIISIEDLQKEYAEQNNGNILSYSIMYAYAMQNDAVEVLYYKDFKFGADDLFYMDTLFRKHDKFKSIFDSDDYKIEKFL